MPWEFWALTPAEFNVLTRGHQERFNLERKVDAWRLSHIKGASGNYSFKNKHLLEHDAILRSCPGYRSDHVMEAIYGGD